MRSADAACLMHTCTVISVLVKHSIKFISVFSLGGGGGGGDKSEGRRIPMPRQCQNAYMGAECMHRNHLDGM